MRISLGISLPFALRGYLDILDLARRWRNRRTAIPQAFEVKRDRFPDRLLGLCHGRSCGNTTRKIGYVRRKIRPSVLDHHCIAHEKVTHFLMPACSRILFSVPGAKLSPGFPATVTRPAFPGCLNC